MFWLGLILPVCYIAGVTGATIPTQWAVLSVGLLPALWRPGEVSEVHVAGLWFVAFAVASSAWSLEVGLGPWVACIWALAFWYGSTAGDLDALWQGLAVGLAANSGLAVAQYLGFESVPARGAGGLLFNSLTLGACCALVFVALAVRGRWGLMLPLVPGLLVSQSRGAWAAVAIAGAARYLPGWWWLGLVLAGAVAVVVLPGQSDLMRVHFWTVALQHLTWLGNGAGSFNVVQVLYRGSVVRAENVHNDFIQLIFEFGLVGLVPIGILLLGLRRKNETDWPVLVAFAVLALVYFPLWSPISAFIGCAVAGHVLRRNDPAGGVLGGRGSGVLAGRAHRQSAAGPARGCNISAFERSAKPSKISTS